MERTRKRTQLNVDIGCTEYVQDAAERVTRALSTPQTYTPLATIKTIDFESTVNASVAETIVATGTTMDDVENPAPLIPWMFKGANEVELFTFFRRRSVFLIVIISNLENTASSKI